MPVLRNGYGDISTVLGLSGYRIMVDPKFRRKIRFDVIASVGCLGDEKTFFFFFSSISKDSVERKRNKKLCFIKRSQCHCLFRFTVHLTTSIIGQESALKTLKQHTQFTLPWDDDNNDLRTVKLQIPINVVFPIYFLARFQSTSKSGSITREYEFRNMGI